VNDQLVERREAPTFGIGVLLERRYKIIGGNAGASFKMPVWSLNELTVHRSDAPTGGIQKTVVHESPESLKVLWTGLTLRFYRDGGESYWHTLVGQQQQLHVICQSEHGDEDFAPVLVTADYDEAMAYQEADDTLLSAPMPQNVCHVLERFVLENYKPEQRRRRKRKQWHGEAEDETFSKRPKA